MNVNLTPHAATGVPQSYPPAPKPPAGADDQQVRETFHRFVGRAMFGQLLGAMRKTVGKPAYFHGGRAEEIFQHQLDDVLAEKLTQASAATFSEPMYQLFRLGLTRR